MLKTKKFNKKLAAYLLVFLTVLIVLLMILKSEACAPFGKYSLASNDGNIQYLDFYAYLKDIFQGKQSLKYSFSNLLGQSGISLYSYYLSSPFNVLLIFFDKPSLPSFYDITWTLKISTAAVTCAYYLNFRFQNKLDYIWVIMLSVCYAMMQYSFAQAGNLMWLDGVYMLPLIMAGVYDVVRRRKISPFLSICIGLAILFNWYSAGIICVFSIFFVLFEYLLYEGKKDLKDFVKTIIQYGLSMILGGCLSAVLFLPTVLFLLEGKGGSFDWRQLSGNIFGNLLSFAGNYEIGSEATKSVMALYCGSVPLIGTISLFFSKNYDVRKKVVFAILLTFCILSLSWTPLFFIFSLFKEASSYFFRYSYISEFILIYLSAFFFIKEEDGYRVLTGEVVTLICLGVSQYLLKNEETGNGKLTLLLLVLSSAVVLCISFSKGRHKNIWLPVLFCICVCELVLNGTVITDHHRIENAESFYTYANGEEKLIDQVQKKDSGFYRITQTLTRNQSDYYGTTTHLNESLAYHYMSVEGYASTVPFNENIFLDHLGYRSEFQGIITCKTFSVPSTDSLLGVKYVLSPYDIKGLVKCSDFSKTNQKNVYRNTYALPMVLRVNGSPKTEITYQENPFVYQNEIYRTLSGMNTDIYEPCHYVKKTENGKTVYLIDCPDGNVSLYGNLPWKSQNSGRLNGNLDLNGKASLPYAKWMSLSVFPVPFDKNEKIAYVSVPTDQKDFFKDIQFYALNLDTLKKVTDYLKKNNEGISPQLKNGSVDIHVKVTGNQYLFTSIPYEKGWTVEINHKKIKPELLDDCMMMIPLKEGNNHITMEYHVPGMSVGIIISSGALLIVILIIIKQRRGKLWTLSERS